MKADIYLFSTLPDEEVRAAQINPCKDIGQLVRELSTTSQTPPVRKRSLLGWPYCQKARKLCPYLPLADGKPA